jgi:hypothetical protein
MFHVFETRTALVSAILSGLSRQVNQSSLILEMSWHCFPVCLLPDVHVSRGIWIIHDYCKKLTDLKKPNAKIQNYIGKCLKRNVPGSRVQNFNWFIEQYLRSRNHHNFILVCVCFKSGYFSWHKHSLSGPSPQLLLQITVRLGAHWPLYWDLISTQNWKLHRGRLSQCWVSKLGW